MASSPRLRVGFVPEHFSTPLHFAQEHYGLKAELIPFPSGTGHMITSLRAKEIDVGIGLTEGWIAGLGRKPGEERGKGGYTIVGTYVETPLCWAISTGKDRPDIKGVAGLRGKKIGVSRIGSGSHVMGFVLADKHGWLSPPTQSSASSSGPTASSPFPVIPLQTFANLRHAVNDRTADFFMWEHFTSKRYYDSGEIRRVGEIYTPWSSWKIAARDDLEERVPRLEELFTSLNQGVTYFEENQEEAVEYISTNLDYSEADARAWLRTVKFAREVKGVKESVVEGTVRTLEKAGVLAGGDRKTTTQEIGAMIGIRRKE